MRRYDEDPRLADLLSGPQRSRLAGALSRLSGVPVDIDDNPDAGMPVELNLEEIGAVRADLPAPQLAAATDIVTMMALGAARYRVAANMHVDGMQERYDVLRAKHEALLASEARYRELSATLQQRVDEQVSVIANAQRNLYESAHLRLVGQLTAGLAHEINTPAGFIISNLGSALVYLDELAALLPPGSAADMLADFRDLLTESRAGARRIAAIVAHLRTFANIDDADFVPCDVAALAGSVAQLLAVDLPAHARLDTVLAPVPHVAGFPARISQAIYNVLHNAMLAVAERGSLIRLETCLVDGLVAVRVEDDGPGIDPAWIDRVFDPFFTTRDVGAGTGLGLTVARDVMRAHHGDVSILTLPAGGCRVELRFHSET